ncbi:hypothetical protein BJY52DRAFT_1154920 [Lactarius psammicola]|nr:hypothetical protein BJY52DRAFT_1154920 [Lactarius psammicola]
MLGFGDLTTTLPCFVGRNTIVDVINCFDAYTVPSGAYSTLEQYNAAQPNSVERADWNQAISTLLGVDNTCAPGLLPAGLDGKYTITQYDEPSTGKSFCILSETQLHPDGYYLRGWGLVVVPSTRALVSRTIHISAPHPRYDPRSPQHAAAVFSNTGAKSLLISGRHRNANGNSSLCRPEFNITDAAHDNNEPFFDANKQIRNWQGEDCPSASCAFIQIHRQISCPSDTVFLSAGIGNSPTSVTWYTTVDSPVVRIKNELDITFPPGPSWSNSLPSTSPCGLTATQNIFGRLLNGIDESLVCTNGSNAAKVTGQFVHIEQTDGALTSVDYGLNFATAVNRAMETTCQVGMHMDGTSLLCVPTP